MSLTQEDLTNIESIVSRIANDTVAASEHRLMYELAKKADKADVDRMESRVIAANGLVERDNNDRIDDLERRVDRLEYVTAH